MGYEVEIRLRPLSIPDATAPGHALNLDTAGRTFAKLAGGNTWTGAQSFAGATVTGLPATPQFGSVLGKSSGTITGADIVSAPEVQSALAGRAAATLANVDPTTGRTALGLGTSATRDVGTTAGTVSAGNDSRWASIVRSTSVTTITTLTQAAYDALPVKDAATWYVITG